MRALSSDAFAEYDGGRGGSRVLSMAASRDARLLIAECPPRRVGFALVEVARARAHLGAIAVVRAMRGTGVGRRLLREAEDCAQRMGALEMHLETGEANVEAMALFVRAGYRREGRVKRYYRAGYDALIYAKVLTPVLA